MLVELFKAGWSVDEVVKRLVIGKGLSSFVRSWVEKLGSFCGGLWRTRLVAQPGGGSAVGEAGRHKRADRLNNLPGPAAVDRPASSRARFRARHRETRSLAHSASQRGCEEGVGGDVKRLQATGLRSILPLRRRGALASLLVRNMGLPSRRRGSSPRRWPSRLKGRLG